MQPDKHCASTPPGASGNLGASNAPSRDEEFCLRVAFLPWCPGEQHQRSLFSRQVLRAFLPDAKRIRPLFNQYQHLATPGVPFSPPVVFGHGVQLALRCYDSEWSGPLGAPRHLTIGSKVYNYPTLKQRATAGASQYDLGLTWAPCEAPFHRTTLITVAPCYILANRLEEPLEFSQGTCMDTRLGVLQPREENPFHWPWTDKKKHLQVRIATSTTSSTGDNVWQWSCDFPIDAVGELHVKLHKAGSLPNDKRILILRVNIELVEASVVVGL